MTRKKILLVDDSPTAILYGQRVLGQGPYDLMIALDGEEALKKAVDHHPDLILLDVVMPKLEGFEVLRELTALPRSTARPCLPRSPPMQYAFLGGL